MFFSNSYIIIRVINKKTYMNLNVSKVDFIVWCDAQKRDCTGNMKGVIGWNLRISEFDWDI